MQDPKELLENWGSYFGGKISNGFSGISLYLSPEEKAQMGPTCRESRINEADAMRAEAVVAMLRQSALFKSFAILLEKHFMYRANPSNTCRKLSLAYNGYDQHVDQAVKIFATHWQIYGAVPTKAIRTTNLNNRLTGKISHPSLGYTT
ncbi:hypothetical protein [Silvimonas sp.]|uniref:hypothetical protein n=1 Tax=Silvimonas sp. TaxID=2650811 RepID=UPI00284DC09C|nr:hypothetical protein [Silvimonas sp.]MDR3427956.1 hypothetical protein [Silvimonas sp.]